MSLRAKLYQAVRITGTVKILAIVPQIYVIFTLLILFELLKILVDFVEYILCGCATLRFVVRI
jgi:hypothetical protein